MNAVASLSVARLVKLEQEIGAAESGGLRARWTFGKELLAARDGKGRLPNGYLVAISAETGASTRELKYRAAFAARFVTEMEMGNAVARYGSWHAIVNDALPVKSDDEPRPIAVPPEGIFRTICADPPWQYGNTATRGAAEDHYGTMSLDELCDPEWVGAHVPAADDAHLYLWTTNGFLREAFDVMAAWGFTYKTCVTWVKPQLGIGNYFRGSSEHVLFGLRGRLPMTDKNQPTWFQANRTRHSAKPDSFYDLVEKVSPGPYLELFSRRRRFGWEAWGDEA